MPAPRIEEDGAYAGWMTWANRMEGRFPDVALGPIYWRDMPDGQVEVMIDTDRHHTNPGDVLHGGFLMAFADMALYAVGWPAFVESRGATVSCGFEFLGPGQPGAPVQAIGEIMKETGKMVFVRAILRQEQGPLLSVTGTLRKIRAPDGAKG